MTAKELLKQLRKQPFQPFEVVTSSGDRYPVRHPELALLSEGGVLYIFKPVRSTRAEVASPDIISLLHVVALEPAKDKAA